MSILGKNGEALANFDVHLEHIYRAQTTSELMLHLTVTQGTSQQSLMVPYNQLNQLDIQRLIPGCIYLARGAKSKIIQQVRLSLAQKMQAPTQIGTLYTKSGWHNGPSGKLFVAGEKIISEKGIANPDPTNAVISEHVAQLHLAVDSSLTPAQSSEQLLRELSTYEDYAIPVFSYTLYSMLHSIWSNVDLPAACVLNLIGTQGYGKTTLARNFCALYSHSTGQIADFYDAHSTQASMRNALCEARDRCIVVDDICKSTSTREMHQRRDLFGYILKMAANETPVAKECRGDNVNSICVSGLVLTGELPLEVPSDVTRSIIINVNRPLRNGNPHIRTITATAVAAYIQWLCAHFLEEMECLRQSYQTFSQKDTLKEHWRLQKSLFQLDWAFGSFLRFAKSAQAISETAQQQFEKRSSDIAQRIFNYEDDIVQRIENAQPTNWKQLILAGACNNTFPCKQKHGCLCVRPSDLADFLRTVLHNSALQEQEIINALKRQNLLLMDKSGKSTKKVSGTRMLNINLFGLQQLRP